MQDVSRNKSKVSDGSKPRDAWDPIEVSVITRNLRQSVGPHNRHHECIAAEQSILNADVARGQDVPHMNWQNSNTNGNDIIQGLAKLL